MDHLLLFAQETANATASKSSSGFLILIILLLVVALLLKFSMPNKRSKGSKNDWKRREGEDDASIGSYTYSRKPALTPTERDFFIKLYAAAKTHYWVFAKVSLHDVVKNNEYAGWSKIAQKHVDFVLCDPRDASVVLAIELDDWTHNKSNAQKRDAQKDDVLESAGVPLLRVKVGDNDTAIIAVKNKLLEITRRA